jgi:dihydroxyacetone kinase-like protein
MNSPASPKKPVDMTRTVGVSTKPGSIPATGKPTFELADDVIGLGMGIHGEKGVGLIPMCTADELAAKMLDLLFGDDLALNSGDEIVFFVNSLGSTHMMELLILLRGAKPILDQRGIKIHQTIVDNIVTCQEMAGVSFSITKLDAELKKLWDCPARAWATPSCKTCQGHETPGNLLEPRQHPSFHPRDADFQHRG